MQGMPAKLTTIPAAKTAVKGEAKSPGTTVVNGKVVPAQTNATKATSGATPEIQGEKSQGSFADLFSGLVGNEANKVEGKGEKVEKLPAQMAEEVKAQASAETKIDALLKNKGQGEQIAKNSDNKVMSTEQALSPEVLQNINNLLVKAPPADDKAPAKDAIGDKVAKSSSNLDQLLKTLKGENAEGAEHVEGEEVKDVKNTKSSPLDFLLKQSKESDVGSTSLEGAKEGKLLNSNPDMVSKLGLSSEDFVSHMGVAKKESKDGKELKDKNGKVIDLDGQMMDQKDVLAKANTSVKSYGQKQNLLDNGLIKNTHDLAFKENKSKASADELKNPDMKIGSEFSNAKDPFIPVMTNKNEQGPQMEAQNAGKVLDISKMDTSNHTEIIKRISDYVQQNQVANSDSLDLTVKHDSLGQFKIQVNKPMDPRSNQMDMQITTSTKEGHDFFVKNEIGLMKNLNQAGIQLSDLRIVSGGETASFAQNDSRQSGQNSQQAPREFMSFENGDFSQGSDRRRELWQEARANQQRYGA